MDKNSRALLREAATLSAVQIAFPEPAPSYSARTVVCHRPYILRRKRRRAIAKEVARVCELEADGDHSADGPDWLSDESPVRSLWTRWSALRAVLSERTCGPIGHRTRTRTFLNNFR
jgi:hypothetical protein